MSTVSTNNNFSTTTTLQTIFQLVKNDLEIVNTLTSQHLQTDIELINQVTTHILQSGGKRLRPLLVLLSAKALGYEGSNHCLLATIIELIHTATLLHDDVVDHSTMRRGRNTVNALWGNQASILVGDFLYSRTFQMMADLNCMRIMAVFAEATNTIASGEVLQLTNCRRIETSEAEYLEVIRRKTAKLFEAATQLGAITAQANSAQELAMARYGLHLGITYQLIDDALDYCAPPEMLGKTLGNDLAEGKLTLPLLHALEKGTTQQVATLKEVLAQPNAHDFTVALEIIKTTGALEYTYQLAAQHQKLASHALAEISDSDYHRALLALTSVALNRTH